MFWRESPVDLLRLEGREGKEGVRLAAIRPHPVERVAAVDATGEQRPPKVLAVPADEGEHGAVGGHLGSRRTIPDACCDPVSIGSLEVHAPDGVIVCYVVVALEDDA